MKNMKTTIEIKDINGSVLYRHEAEDNSIRKAVEAAVINKANLRDANLRDAKYIPFVPMACPSDGAFVGWKRVRNCLVKLLIPEDAKRLSATTSKCRCDKAQVLEITNINTGQKTTEILNDLRDSKLLYKVGETVYPDSFDEDRFNECSHGIHFFIDKREAE